MTEKQIYNKPTLERIGSLTEDTLCGYDNTGSGGHGFRFDNKFDHRGRGGHR